MSFIVKVVKAVVGVVLNIVIDIVITIWQEIIVPIVEQIAALFGIVDETVVQVTKVSTKLYGQNVTNPSVNAIIRAVLGKNKDTDYSHSFFDHYWFQINSTKVDLTTFYRYGLNQYTHGIPSATMHGTTVSSSGVSSALTSEFGATAVSQNTTSTYPTELQYFQYDFQASPYLYHAPSGTLTFEDSATLVTYTDWAIGNIFFNTSNTNYEVTLTRQAQLAQFWITGSANTIEGNTATYTVHSTRPVPAGKTITINLVYGGSAPPTDYTAVTSVVMLAETSSVDFTVSTAGNALLDGNREFTVSIGTIDNSTGVFEDVSSKVPSTVSTLIHDDESPTLLVSDGTVAEGTANITVDVTLINTPGVAFTVDYTTVAGTATAGADYVTKTGTLSFVGTLDEVQTVTVTIISDLADDSGETFNIVLSNCSEPSVDITSQGIVTITDASAGYAPTTSTTEEIVVQPNFTRKQSVIIEYYFSDTDPNALNWKYWIYEVATNVYPSLAPISDTSTDFELFPIVVLRKNKVSLNSYGTEAAKTSARNLLKKLNLDLDEIISNLEANPDIAVIKDAYLNISVNPLDTGQAIAKLLWHLFYPVIVETPVASNQNKFFLTFEEDGVQNAIAWSSQSYTPSITGVVGVSGTYTHVISGTSLIVNRQIDASRYDKIVIDNAGSFAAINYLNHHEVASNTLGDKDFTIPVSWYTLNQLTPKEQMDVYSKIIRMDFYAIQITEIKWYQTEAFMTLFQIVIIVITIAAPYFAPATAGAATAAEATASQLLLQGVKQVAINYAIAAVVSKIAALTGNETLAAIVGIVAAIAFSPQGTDFSSLGKMMDAEKLLSLSFDFANNLASSYQTTAAIDAQELSEDINEFNTAASARLDEIRQAGYTPAVDAEFLALLRSVDAQSAPAIDGIYQYNAIFDYDRIVANYNENLLQVGVI